MKFFHSFILSPYKAMQEWRNRIGDMLAYVNDVLTPHGFDETVKDDFAALRQMDLVMDDDVAEGFTKNNVMDRRSTIFEDSPILRVDAFEGTCLSTVWQAA
jgi:hypothetical protein